MAFDTGGSSTKFGMSCWTRFTSAASRKRHLSQTYTLPADIQAKFPPPDFFTTYLNPADLPRRIHRIYLISFDAFDNHWSFFLELSAMESVRVDMGPFDHNTDSGSLHQHRRGRRGRLNVYSKNYNVSCNFIKLETISIYGKTTVQDVLDLLAKRGRQRYKFTKEGKGAGYWCTVVVKDWEGMGLVSPGSWEKARDVVTRAAETGEGEMMMMAAEGEFWDGEWVDEDELELGT